MIAGERNLSVLVQSQRDHTCAGFSVVGVERPVRVLVAGDAPYEERALVSSLELALRNLSAAGGPRLPPCSGTYFSCRADGEAGTRNFLAWVGSDGPPTAESTELVSDWLGGGGREAVALLPPHAAHDEALPDELRPLQTIRWDGRADEAASQVLAAAGVLDPDYRLFVSYSHEDGTELAHALFAFLSRLRFQVFLDAFSLAPGRDFAERIEHELLDRSFLLLVESPAADTSGWIKREVKFARSHRLGLAAVNLDGSSPRAPGIGDARRIAVDSSDVNDSALDPAIARRVGQFIVERHGESMLHRREVLDVGLRAALGREGVPGGDVRPMAGGLEVDAGGRYAVSLFPRPAGLLDMNAADRRAASGYEPVAVSATPRGAPERSALEWLDDKVRHHDEGRLLTLARQIRDGTL